MKTPSTLFFTLILFLSLTTGHTQPCTAPGVAAIITAANGAADVLPDCYGTNANACNAVRLMLYNAEPAIQSAFDQATSRGCASCNLSPLLANAINMNIVYSKLYDMGFSSYHTGLETTIGQWTDPSFQCDQPINNGSLDISTSLEGMWYVKGKEYMTINVTYVTALGKYDFVPTYTNNPSYAYYKDKINGVLQFEQWGGTGKVSSLGNEITTNNEILIRGKREPANPGVTHWAIVSKNIEGKSDEYCQHTPGQVSRKHKNNSWNISSNISYHLPDFLYPGNNLTIEGNGRMTGTINSGVPKHELVVSSNRFGSVGILGLAATRLYDNPGGFSENGSTRIEVPKIIKTGEEFYIKFSDDYCPAVIYTYRAN